MSGNKVRGKFYRGSRPTQNIDEDRAVRPEILAAARCIDQYQQMAHPKTATVTMEVLAKVSGFLAALHFSWWEQGWWERLNEAERRRCKGLFRWKRERDLITGTYSWRAFWRENEERHLWVVVHPLIHGKTALYASHTDDIAEAAKAGIEDQDTWERIQGVYDPTVPEAREEGRRIFLENRDAATIASDVIKIGMRLLEDRGEIPPVILKDMGKYRGNLFLFSQVYKKYFSSDPQARDAMIKTYIENITANLDKADFANEPDPDFLEEE